MRVHVVPGGQVWGVRGVRVGWWRGVGVQREVGRRIYQLSGGESPHHANESKFVVNNPGPPGAPDVFVLLNADHNE